jgi:dephospho-CoA kinase
MKWIGLTGGIATGKSTVTKWLRTLGYEVLDADEISHQITSLPGPALNEIFQTFGQEVRRSDGSLDRQALGALVFGQAAQLKKLEAIVHPLVLVNIAAEKERFRRLQKSAVFYDVPLLYELSMQLDFDAVVFVYCEPAQQLQRLMQRNGLTKVEAEKRIASQWTVTEKRKHSQHVILNTGDLNHLEAEVRRVLKELGL